MGKKLKIKLYIYLPLIPGLFHRICRLEKDKFIAKSDIEQARALNMEEDKPSSSNKGKGIDEGSASETKTIGKLYAQLEIDVGSASENKMTGELFEHLDKKLKGLPSQQDCFECCIYRVSKRVQSVHY